MNVDVSGHSGVLHRLDSHVASAQRSTRISWSFRVTTATVTPTCASRASCDIFPLNGMDIRPILHIEKIPKNCVHSHIIINEFGYDTQYKINTYLIHLGKREWGIAILSGRFHKSENLKSKFLIVFGRLGCRPLIPHNLSNSLFPHQGCKLQNSPHILEIAGKA